MPQELLSGVPETMLQTLYARAKETNTGRGFLQDPKAAEIVSELSYDFSEAEKDRAMYTGVVARTILLDRMTKEFLTAHPGTMVLNMACGLDTRCCRMEGLYDRWYNLDLPETMAVRRRFFKETQQIRQISCSAMEEGWLAQVEDREGPVLVILEGLSMYLQQEEVCEIFHLLSRKFPHAVVFLEIMNPWVVSHVKERSIEGSKAKFTWGISGGKAFQKLVPSFASREDHSLVEGMQVFLPVYKYLGKIPFVKNISNKILVLEK